MQRILKLINNEKKNILVKGAKGCDSTSVDYCKVADYGECTLYSYDTCGTDYSSCSAGALDGCISYTDYQGCSGPGPSGEDFGLFG